MTSLKKLLDKALDMDPTSARIVAMHEHLRLMKVLMTDIPHQQFKLACRLRQDKRLRTYISCSFRAIMLGMKKSRTELQIRKLERII